MKRILLIIAVLCGVACSDPEAQSTCTDGARNGTETDVDCGGSCGPCGDAMLCAASTDCVSAVCSARICQAAAEPTIASFTAASAAITTGTSTRLTATFSGGTGRIDQGLGEVSSGAAISTGNLSETRTFTLTVTSPTGKTATKTVQVSVAAEPKIESFTATPTFVTAGETTTLVPTFTGGTATITPGIGEVTSGNPVATPVLTTETVFTLTVTSASGATVAQRITIFVTPAPVAESFVAASESVTIGQPARLTAVFSNGQGFVNHGVGTVFSGLPFTTDPITTDTPITLTVTNETGATAVKQLMILAVPAPSITSFEADTQVVLKGEATDLTAVYADGIGSIDYGVGLVGSGTSISTGAINETTTFTLTVTNAAGDSVQRDVVVVAVPAPSVTSFTAASAAGIGKATTLTAVFEGESASIDHGVGAVSSGEPVSTGNLTADTTFTLTVTNRFGHETTESVLVKVVPPPVISGLVSDAPVQKVGSSVSLTATFEDGTGTIDHGVGAVTSGVAVTTPVLQADTTFTLTVTNEAGEVATRSVFVKTTTSDRIFGTAADPGTSCKQILESGCSIGDGLYWIQPNVAASAYQVHCDMTLDGGGWTLFFAGTNGSPNVFNHFDSTAADCTDPASRCLRRLPQGLTSAIDIAATCGDASVSFVPSTNAFDYFQNGGAHQWTSLTNVTALGGNAHAAAASYLWTGEVGGNHGWILSRYTSTSAAIFASSYATNSDWDRCNGVRDTSSPVTLMYRERPAVSFSVIAAKQIAPGQASSVVVSALDTYGVLVRDYTGQVRLETSAGGTPVDVTFGVADQGRLVIPVEAFAQEGTQRVTVTAVGHPEYVGQATITVTATPSQPRSCLEVLLRGDSVGDGEYSIVVGGTARTAYCDMTTQQGGWTLILSTAGGQGASQTTEGNALSGQSVRLPIASMQALANMSSQLHIRTKDAAANASVTSWPWTQPILNMREGKRVNAPGAPFSLNDFYGPYATAEYLAFTCAGGDGYPRIYQACGGTGLHLLDEHSRWLWSNGDTAANVPMELYFR